MPAKLVTTLNCYMKHSRVLDPGHEGTQTDIRQGDGWHTTTTLTLFPIFFPSYFLFFLNTLAWIENAKPVMHATGGEKDCTSVWDMHFVFPLGSLTIAQHLFSLNKNLVWLCCYKQTQPMFAPMKLLPLDCCIKKKLTFMHPC